MIYNYNAVLTLEEAKTSSHACIHHGVGFKSGVKSLDIVRGLIRLANLGKEPFKEGFD